MDWWVRGWGIPFGCDHLPLRWGQSALKRLSRNRKDAKLDYQQDHGELESCMFSGSLKKVILLIAKVSDVKQYDS